MATNYVQEGDVLTLTAPAGGVVSGTGYLIGSLFVVALVTAAEGASFTASVEGVFTLPKTSAQAWTEGQKVFWDNSNHRADSDSTVGQLIGVAAAVAADPSSTGNVRLNCASPELTEGKQAAVADLTENAGAIGGTNDGDLPDLTATAAALTENAGAIGGTNDGDLPALVDPAGDAGASLIAGVRETATSVNELVADNIALRAAVRELAAKQNALLAAVRAAGIIAA